MVPPNRILNTRRFRRIHPNVLKICSRRLPTAPYHPQHGLLCHDALRCLPPRSLWIAIARCVIGSSTYGIVCPFYTQKFSQDRRTRNRKRLLANAFRYLGLGCCYGVNGCGHFNVKTVHGGIGVRWDNEQSGHGQVFK